MSGIRQIPYENGIAFLRAFLSQLNEERAVADQLLIHLRLTNRNFLFNWLFSGLDSSEPLITQLALFLIRQEFINNGIGIPAQYQQFLIDKILTIIQTQSTQNHMNIAADIICGMKLNNEESQGFLQKLVLFCKGSDMKIKMFGLLTCIKVCENPEGIELIKPYAEDLISVFMNLFDDINFGIRMQAAKTVIRFIEFIDEKKSNNIDICVNTVIVFLINTLKSNEEEGRKILEALYDLTVEKPIIWKKYLSDIIIVCSQISAATKFQMGTRLEAANLIITIAESLKSSFRKIIEVKTYVFPTLLQMLSEYDFIDNLEEWTLYEESQQQGDLRSNMNIESDILIDKLGEILGGKAMCELMGTAEKYANSEDWTKRCAWIQCIGIISATCKKIFQQDLVKKQVLEKLFWYMNNDDEHIRVKYHAVISLGFFVSALAPDIQKTHHKLILNELVKMMSMSKNVKLTTGTVMCLVTFCKEIDDEDSEEILDPYYKIILSQFSLFFNDVSFKYLPLQSEMLSCISIIASIIKEKFQPFYNEFIPKFKVSLFEMPAKTNKQKEQRSSVIKGIAYILSCLDSNTYPNIIKDAQELVEFIINLIKTTKYTIADEELESIITFLGNSSTILQSEYSKYLPVIMPFLFEFSNINVPVKIIDHENPMSIKEPKKDLTVLIGSKELSINTNQYVVIIKALDAIREICINCTNKFVEYAPKIAQLMIETLKPGVPSFLRKGALQIFAPLIETYYKNEDRIYVFMLIFVKLAEFLALECVYQDMKEINFLMKELYNAIKIFTKEIKCQIFDLTNLDKLFGMMFASLNAFMAYYQEKIKEMEQIDDQIDLDEVNLKLNKDAKITMTVSKICRLIIILYGDKCDLNMKSIIIPFYTDFSMNCEKCVEIQKACLKFFSSYVKYMQNENTKESTEIIKKELKNLISKLIIKNQNVGISQKILERISKGIGNLAEFLHLEINNEFLRLVIPHLINIIKNSDEKDHAICAIGKICMFCYKEIQKNNPKIIIDFLNLLPIDTIKYKNQCFYDLLFNQISQSNPAFIEYQSEVRSMLQRVKKYEMEHPDTEIPLYKEAENKCRALYKIPDN